MVHMLLILRIKSFIHESLVCLYLKTTLESDALIDMLPSIPDL
jgi:hypothetical protein